MNRIALGGLATIILVACATVFAAFKYVAMADARAQMELKSGQLENAKAMLQKNRGAFAGGGQNFTPAALKNLVQQSSAQHGVTIIYLNDNEKEIGEKVHECNVVWRAVNVKHSNLVLHLADLEARAGGAKIREIRLKPSPFISDVYAEAETVLTARRATLQEPAKGVQ